MNKKLIPTILIAIFAISILATAFPTQPTLATTRPGELRVSTTQFYGFSVIKIAVYDPDGVSTDTWELWKDGTRIIANLTKYATYTTAGEYVIYIAANATAGRTMIYPLQYKVAKAIEDAESELNDAYKYAVKAIAAAKANWTTTELGVLQDIDNDGILDYVVNLTTPTGLTAIYVDLYADYATSVNFDNATIANHPEKVDMLVYNATWGGNLEFCIDIDPDSTPSYSECDYNFTAVSPSVPPGYAAYTYDLNMTYKYDSPKAKLLNWTYPLDSPHKAILLYGYDDDADFDLLINATWVAGVGLQAYAFHNSTNSEFAGDFNVSAPIDYGNLTYVFEANTTKTGLTAPYVAVLLYNASTPTGFTVLVNYTLVSTDKVWFVDESPLIITAHPSNETVVTIPEGYKVINGSGLMPIKYDINASRAFVGAADYFMWPSILLLPLSEGDKLVVKYTDAEDAYSTSATILYDDMATSISYDRTEYPPKGRVYITLTDSDYNFDPTVNDYVFVNDYTPITVTVNPGTAIETAVALNSTGLDFFKESSSNEFEAKLSLEGMNTTVVSGDTVRVKFGDYKKSFTIKTESGTISASASAMDYSDTITITVSDFDLNKDSKAKDTVIINTTVMCVDGTLRKHAAAFDQTAIYYAKLTETGENTGVFTGTITATWDNGSVDHSVDGNVLWMLKGDKARIVYKDTAPVRENTWTVDIVVSEPSIELDKASYPLGATVKVTITDNNLNDKSDAKEIYTSGSLPGIADGVPHNSAVMITVTNSSGVFKNVTLPAAKDRIVETGTDTGVFELKFSLADVGANEPGASIKVEFYDGIYDRKVGYTASVAAHTAEVVLDRAGYYIDHKIVVTIKDPDLNLNPDSAESHTFWYTTSHVTGKYVISLTDTQSFGYTTAITGWETGPDTGEFVIKYFDLTGILSANDLGGTIQVMYNDTAGAGGGWTNVTVSASITANTGTVELDKSTYPINATVYVTVTDPDLNRDPDSVDNTGTRVKWWTTTMGEAGAQTVTLYETGPNTGVFTGTFKLAGANVRQGDTLYVRYTDAHDAAYTSDVKIDKTASVYVTTGKVYFDKKVYPMFAKVTIYVEDPDMNWDPVSKQSVTITVKSSLETESSVTATETEADSGVFKATIVVKPDDVYTTAVAGDGILRCSKSGDTIVAIYTDERTAEGGTNVQIQATATVKQFTAEIWFEKDRYNMGEEAVVWVYDPDANQNPDLKDSITIRVYSDQDPAGMTVNAVENGTSTGYFKATIIPSTSTVGNKIMAEYGGTVYAKYTDYTPEGETGTKRSVSVSDSFIVGALVEYPVPASEPSIIDPTTGQPTTPEVGKTVSIASTITNEDVVAKSFTYFVQIKDATGTVIYLAWMSGTLEPGQSLTPALGWTPSEAGNYTVEVYVWKSLAEPIPYSLVQTITVTVS